MGKMIVLEGPEGSGKTTQAYVLAGKAALRGQDYVLTKEPGDTPMGEKIEDMLRNNEPCHLSEFYLFLADRAQHIEEVINPALARDKLVICDRFSLSTLAYQGPLVDPSNKKDVGERAYEFTKRVDKHARSNLKGDVHILQILLDLSVEESLRRSGQSDRIEQRSKEYHEEVAYTFRHHHTDLLMEDGVSITCTAMRTHNMSQTEVTERITQAARDHLGVWL